MATEAASATITSPTTSSLLNNSLEYYLTDYWFEHGDPRSATYPLTGTFKYALAIHFTYYFIVLYFGPRLMRHREPFSLKWIIIPYNLIMSLFNAYCFYRLVGITRFGSLIFDPDINGGFETNTTEEQNLIYMYWISKYVDMLDTIFFIMRKKYIQVSGLHVYHHSMVPLMGWIYFRTKIEHVSAAAFALLNAPVHTIMYGYYGLAAIGPHMQPYLWWKRYITQFQIVQFVLLFAYGVYFALFNKGYHPLFTYDVLIQSPLYLYLFTSFYIRTYKEAAVQRQKKNGTLKRNLSSGADGISCSVRNGNSKKTE